MKTNPVLFIGYNTVDRWLSAIDVRRPVYASMVTEPGEVAQYGIRTDQVAVMLAQPDADVVHYFRALVMELRYVEDQPFDVDHKRKLAAIKDAWTKVQDWLLDHGLDYREAVIAAPKDLRFLDGDFSTIFS